MNLRNANPIQDDRSLESETLKTLNRLVASASFEVLARDIVRRPALLGMFDEGTAIYVPFPPTRLVGRTLAACRVIAERGCRPVPHLPARRLRNRAELISWRSRSKLTTLGL